MQNEYSAPDVVQIGQAQSLIHGTKWIGPFDIYFGMESTAVTNIFYDIDE